MHRRPLADLEPATTFAPLAAAGQPKVDQTVAASPGKSATVEKCLFVGRGRASERNIAVWKATEAPDDIGVQLRPLQEFCIASCAKQSERALLISAVFGVFEWKIEKCPFRLRDLSIEAAGNRTLGDRARIRVGRKGAGLAAEHVTRELVEHDRQRQRAFGSLLPVRELVRCGCLPKRLEPGSDL